MRTLMNFTIYLWYDMTFNNDRQAKWLFEKIEIIFSSMDMYIHYMSKSDR